MAFIHERKAWPRFTWNEASVSAPMADVHHCQGVLYGKMEGLSIPFQTEAGLRARTEDIVKSGAIEGERLDPKTVRSSLARRLGLKISGMEPSNREVDGFVEMLLDATQNWNTPLTDERLFGWHAALFPTGRNGMNKITTGAWRTPASGAMQVVSGPLGKETVHFEAPEASRLPKEMEAFLRWTGDSTGLDPLLRSGVAHLYFVTIHPFEDGNGRISRAISDMILSQGVKGQPRFYSLSAQIEAEREDYYNELESAQRGTLDITPWLSWFVGCCGRAVERAENELAAVLNKGKFWQAVNAKPINDRQRKILNLLLDGFEGKLSTTKYARITKCSEDTALRDLTALIDAGVLKKNGKGGRSTRYELPDIAYIPKEIGTGATASEHGKQPRALDH